MFFPFAIFGILSSVLPAANVNINETGPITPETAASLPAPYATKSVGNFSKVVEWPEGRLPSAPEGFRVNLFARALSGPRTVFVGPEGEVFVAESIANRITLFRGLDGNGEPKEKHVFLQGLNQPFGMAILNGYFYVADVDSVHRYPYKSGDVTPGRGEKILDLPAGENNRHWTRNLLPARDGKKIYVAVGSGTNAAEYGIQNEDRRADILEVNPDGTGERVYASGLRNPVTLAYAPQSDKIWAVVNERDELGDRLVPDYLTSIREHGFYGWPYSYLGNHLDPRVKPQRPDLAKQAVLPDYSLGSHAAALGLAFYQQNAFPSHYRNGAFVGEHGSWNRSTLSGYKVVYVPFQDGKPTGPAEDFLTGFIAGKNEVYGRPVGVAVLADGSLLLADDAGNRLWRVRYSK